MGAHRWNAQYLAFANRIGRAVRKERDLLLSAFLKHQAEQLSMRAPYNGTVRGRAAARRRSRALKVEFLARRFPGKKRRILRRPEALLFNPKPDRVRDELVPGFLQSWVPMRERLRQKDCLEVDWKGFSFARDPGGTLKKLADLVRASASRADLHLNFLDSICDDVTPYLVLAHLRSSLPPVISGGRVSTEIRDVIEAVGLRQSLRMGQLRRAKKEKDYSVSAFPITTRTPPGAFGDEDHQLRPQFKEFVADQFVDTLNGWIGEHDLELTPDAAGSFVRVIGEALDNAERHGDAIEGAEGDWSIAAFSRLFFDSDRAPLLRCSVGIVSVGATISESLVSAAKSVEDAIAKYVGLHSSPLTSPARREALRTVMALQDGITRDPEAALAGRGGVGLMELIDIFAELGDNGRGNLPSAFTIVSGSTCIRVTAPYQQGERRTGRLRELWFNQGNDPGVPPSKEHVMSLDHAFPGVILSACFTIDPANLWKKLDDGDAHAAAN